jgi:hypothetical protein
MLGAGADQKRLSSFPAAAGMLLFLVDNTHDKDGFREFTNEMQHPVLGVLQWDTAFDISIWNNAVKLPGAAKLGNRYGKSRQLWIARHRAWLGN